MNKKAKILLTSFSALGAIACASVYPIYKIISDIKFSKFNSDSQLVNLAPPNYNLISSENQSKIKNLLSASTNFDDLENKLSANIELLNENVKKLNNENNLKKLFLLLYTRISSSLNQVELFDEFYENKYLKFTNKILQVKEINNLKFDEINKELLELKAQIKAFIDIFIYNANASIDAINEFDLQKSQTKDILKLNLDNANGFLAYLNQFKNKLDSFAFSSQNFKTSLALLNEYVAKFKTNFQNYNLYFSFSETFYQNYSLNLNKSDEINLENLSAKKELDKLAKNFNDLYLQEKTFLSSSLIEKNNIERKIAEVSLRFNYLINFYFEVFNVYSNEESALKINNLLKDAKKYVEDNFKYVFNVNSNKFLISGSYVNLINKYSSFIQDINLELNSFLLSKFSSITKNSSEILNLINKENSLYLELNTKNLRLNNLNLTLISLNNNPENNSVSDEFIDSIEDVNIQNIYKEINAINILKTSIKNQISKNKTHLDKALENLYLNSLKLEFINKTLTDKNFDYIAKSKILEKLLDKNLSDSEIENYFIQAQILANNFSADNDLIYSYLDEIKRLSLNNLQDQSQLESLRFELNTNKLNKNFDSSNLEKLILEKEKAIIKNKEEINNLNSLIDSINNQLQEKINEIKLLKIENSNLKNTINQNNLNLNNLRSQLNQNNSNIAYWERQNQELQNQLNEKTNLIRNATEKYNLAKSELDNFKKQNALLSNQYSALRNAAISIKNKLSKFKKWIDEINDAIDLAAEPIKTDPIRQLINTYRFNSPLHLESENYQTKAGRINKAAFTIKNNTKWILDETSEIINVILARVLKN
ncbi:hypothetical protein [Mycoplasmopsis synoviae]|uniref:hypothetical protein n=1 Tax=Mycoplasmopsis synoviae TaxID=2109 RepID=UPI003562BC61